MKDYSDIKTKGIQLIEGSPVIKFAALFIIFAGIIYEKVIIAPILLTLSISIVCIPPISWLGEKRIPRWIFILLGTPAEAKIYLQNNELLNEQNKN